MEKNTFNKKKIILIIFILVLIIISAFLLRSCSAGNTNSGDNTDPNSSEKSSDPSIAETNPKDADRDITYVLDILDEDNKSIKDKTITLKANDTKTYKATIKAGDDSIIDDKWTWTSSDANITIDNNGKLVVKRNITKTFKATITALNIQTEKEVSFNVEVSANITSSPNRPKPTVAPTSKPSDNTPAAPVHTLDILDDTNTSVKDKTVAIKLGETKTFTPVLKTDNKIVSSNAWQYESNNEKVTVSADGKVTLASDTPKDTIATIKVTNNTVKQSISFKVNVYQYTIEIEIPSDFDPQNPAEPLTIRDNNTLKLKAGDTKYLNPRIKDNQGSYIFTYEISDPSKVSVNNGSLKVADDAYENRTYQVIAKANTNPEATITFNIELVNEYELDVEADGSSIKDQQVAIKISKGMTFNPILLVNSKLVPTNISDWTIESSNRNFIINNNQIIIKPNTPKNDISNITLRHNISNVSISFDASIFNYSIELSKSELDNPNHKEKINNNEIIKAIASQEFILNSTVVGADSSENYEVIYISSDPTKVSINNDTGLLKVADDAYRNEAYTITATATSDPIASFTFKIELENEYYVAIFEDDRNTVNDLEIKLTDADLPFSHSYTPKLLINDVRIDANDWTFSSSSNLVKIDNNGTVDIAADAPSNTNATITVTNNLYNASATFSYKIQYYILNIDTRDADDRTITIGSGGTLRLKAGQSRQLNAGIDGLGADEYEVTYGFYDRTKITIDNNGLLKVADDAYKNEVINVTAIANSDPRSELNFNIELVNTYEIDILNSDNNSISSTTQSLKAGDTLPIYPKLKVNGNIVDLGNWSYEASNSNVTFDRRGNITLSPLSEEDTVVTVKNSFDDSISASFTIKVHTIVDSINAYTKASTETVMVDGIEWYILDRDEANGRALLLAKDIIETRAFDENNSSTWISSPIRDYLNNEWLDAHPTIKAKAKLTTIYTQSDYNVSQTTPTKTEDKVFLLSQADIYNSAWSEKGNGDDVAITNNDLYTTGSVLVAPGNNWQANYTRPGTSSPRPYEWRLRSPGGISSTSAGFVSSGWSASSKALSNGQSNLLGLRPAFYYEYLESYDLAILNENDQVISDTTIQLKAGDTYQLKSSLTNKALATIDSKVTYTSDNSCITIDDNGLLSVNSDQIANISVNISAYSATTPISRASFVVQINNDYELDIMDSDGNSIKGQTVKGYIGDDRTFKAQLKVNGKVNNSQTFDWTSSNPDMTIIDGTVAIDSNATINSSAIITVDLADINLSALFEFRIVEIKDIINDISPSTNKTIKIDGIEWYVIAKDASENKALLLTKDIIETRAFNTNIDTRWQNSTLRNYLNNEWLNNHSTIASKAKDTTLYTQLSYRSGQDEVDMTQDKVFLLSQADLFNSASSGSNDESKAAAVTNNQLYTYNNAPLSAPNGTWHANGSVNYYWLRSPYAAYNSVAVSFNKSFSSVTVNTSNVGVRPAFWFDLN